jgi:hypothetical protein
MARSTTTVADVSPSRISADRDVQRRITCDFYTSSGASYFSRTCHMAAAWVEAYVDGAGNLKTGEHSAKRCNRHKAIDIRTASRPGSWRTVKNYLPFDAAAVAADRERTIAAAAEYDRITAVQHKVDTALTYVLTHAKLATDERNMLKQVRQDLNDGKLEVV